MIFRILISSLLLVTVMSQCSKKNSNVTRLTCRQRFMNSSFVYNLTGMNPSQIGPGGMERLVTLDQMQALSGESLSFVLYNLDPCGLNSFHFHPRATELLYVIKGKSIRVGFIEENGGRTIVNEISEGQAALFPRGLIHFEQNLGCEQAIILSALNNEDPGTVTVVDKAFTFPDVALASSFGLTVSQIKTLRNQIPQNGPLAGYGKCMRRCPINSGYKLNNNLNSFKYLVILLIALKY